MNLNFLLWRGEVEKFRPFCFCHKSGENSHFYLKVSHLYGPFGQKRGTAHAGYVPGFQDFKIVVLTLNELNIYALQRVPLVHNCLINRSFRGVLVYATDKKQEKFVLSLLWN